MLETLFDTKRYEAPKTEEWCSDDWETPDNVARFMASLLTEAEKESAIAEPAAGTGRIASFIEADELHCYEINKLRVLAGMSRATQGDWMCTDFLRWSKTLAKAFEPFAVVISKPPFSLAMEFLEASKSVLAEDDRILFLLPSSFFQAKCRADALAKTGLIITKAWQIRGRVAYLKDGKPETGRQCDDSVFEFRLSGKPAVEIVNMEKF